jgi:hypothetical protein
MNKLNKLMSLLSRLRLQCAKNVYSYSTKLLNERKMIRNNQLKSCFHILLIAVVLFCYYLIIDNFNLIKINKFKYSELNYSKNYDKVYVNLVNEDRLNNLFRILYDKELDDKFNSFLRGLGIISFESIVKDSLMKSKYSKEIEKYLRINKEMNEIKIKQKFLDDLFEIFHFYSSFHNHELNNSKIKVSLKQFIITLNKKTLIY